MKNMGDMDNSGVTYKIDNKAFQKEIEIKRLFVLDLDGTFYLGEKLMKGSLEFINQLKKTGREYLFFTNNASKSPEFYIKKLAGMGCFIENKNIATAGDVTIKYLNEHHKGKAVYLLGTGILKESFRKSGIKLVSKKPDIVVVSFDLTLTYEKISKACRFIREGALFYATHLDLNCPTEDGFIPDCGAICAMVVASTGKSPRYFGKPFRETLDMVSVMTGYDKSEMVVVGDRLYTDIAMGRNNGVTSILVLSGETKQRDLENSEIKPDFVFNTIGEIAGNIGNIEE